MTPLDNLERADSKLDAIVQADPISDSPDYIEYLALTEHFQGPVLDKLHVSAACVASGATLL